MSEKKTPSTANCQAGNTPEAAKRPDLLDTLEHSRRLAALAHLSGEVAHDVNNALQVIQNAVEILRRRLPSAEADVTALVDMLSRNSTRAASLMLRLLAFSGRLPLEPRAIDANQLIAGMVTQLREAAGAGDVTVETAFDDGLGQISADPDRLQAAMLSLATNGRDAMPHGGTLTIETRNVSIDKNTIANDNRVPPGEYVSIAVRDNGTGMTPDVIAKVFDPYFTTKEKGYGIGLGLSQVYGFMKQSNGQIDVRSEPGSGSTVTLYFPRMPVTEVTGMPIGPRPLPLGNLTRTHTTGGIAGLRVLVVEDESLIGILIEDLLDQLGCHLIGVISGVKKAREMAESAEIDVALLDVDLGGEPVYPVAAALKVRGIPFVFMSGYGGLEEAWRDRPLVQKPFDMGQLQSALELALGNGL